MVKKENQIRFLGFLKRLQDFQFRMAGKLSVSIETDFDFELKSLDRIEMEVEYLTETFYSTDKPGDWRAKWDNLERQAKALLL